MFDSGSYHVCFPPTEWDEEDGGVEAIVEASTHHFCVECSGQIWYLATLPARELNEKTYLGRTLIIYCRTN